MIRRALVLATVSIAALVPTGAALDPFAECERGVRERPDSREAWRCFYMLARKENAWDRARALLHAHRAASPGNPWILLALANLESDQGTAEAQPLFRSAIDAAARKGDARAEVYARLGLATALAIRERMEEADAELAAAERAAEASADPLLAATVRLEQARQIARKGDDLGRAYRLLREVEPAIFPDGPYQQRLVWLNTSASVCRDIDRPDEADLYRQRLIDLVQGAGDRYVEATIRYNRLSARLDRLEEQGLPADPGLIEEARKVLDTAVASGNRWMEAAAHRTLGDLRDGDARAHHERCLAVARETGEPEGIGDCLRGLAWSEVATDPEQAFRHAAEDLDIARRTADRWETAQARLLVAGLRWTTGPRDEAIADSLVAIGAVESIRDLQVDEQARAGFVSQWRHPYYRLSARLLESAEGTDDVEQAVQVMERMRARILLDRLDQARALPRPRGPSSERRDAVLAEIASVEERLRGGEGNEALRMLARLEEEENRLREALASEDPVFASLRRFDPPTIREVQERLDEAEALLAFQLASKRSSVLGRYEGGSWVVVITRDRVDAFPLPDEPEIDVLVRSFVSVIGRNDGSGRAGAERLHATLLRRALASVPESTRALVLVPDGSLYRLPFDALRASRDEEALGCRLRTEVVPSIGTWLRFRRDGARGHDASALVLADPVLARGAPTGAATRDDVGPLPYARIEARSITRNLHGATRVLVGEAARESALRGGDGQDRFGILHLSAHAVLDDARPERSAVLLAPGPAEEDGRLQVREITGLSLPGKLVVLAACRSAAGPILRGEGVLGFARAFFQAGAPAVVASLWPLRDDDAAEFFDAMYAALGEGATVAEAVRRAREARARAAAPEAAWAGFVVLGDGAFSPIRPRPDAGGGRIALLAVLVLVCVLVWSRARRDVR